MNRSRNTARIERLAKSFESLHGSYDYWTFEFMRQGTFAYHHPDGDLTVFFTPDQTEDGEIYIAVFSASSGVEKQLSSVAFDGPLTPDDLFAVVKGWLDRYRR